VAGNLGGQFVDREFAEIVGSDTEFHWEIQNVRPSPESGEEEWPMCGPSSLRPKSDGSKEGAFAWSLGTSFWGR
jgi:hypothetical protein